MSLPKDSMKKNHSIDLPVLSSNGKTKKYWRSLNMLNNESTKEVQDIKKREFPEGASEFKLENMSPISRRKFFALMTASSAFVFAACTDYRDKGEIIPYNKKPESVLPGVSNYFASTLHSGGKGWGILIKTREGRPIKIDGNPDHPINKGKIDSIAHARIMDLWDPKRLQNPISKKDGNKEVSWEELNKSIISKLSEASAQGKKIIMLGEKITSPTHKNLIDEIKNEYPSTEYIAYDLYNDNNRQTAWRKSYNTSSNFPLIALDKAKYIVSIDCDFLGVDGDSIENTANYTKTRDTENLDNFSRFYAFEAGMTLTGANADYRFRLNAENYLDLLVAIINELAPMKGYSKISGFKSLNDLANANSWSDDKLKVLKKDIKELLNNNSIVLAGKQLPESVHYATNYLNEIIGGTKLYRNDTKEISYGSVKSFSELKNIVKDLNNGNVGVLINYDTNPVFNLPVDLDFATAVSKAGTVITFSEFENETTEKSDYIIPINHDLEAWGDSQVREGVISTQQPVISPLYNTRQKEAVILSWIKNSESYTDDIYHRYLMDYWKENIYTQAQTNTSFKEFWLAALHDGVFKYNSSSISNLSFDNTVISNIKPINRKNFTLLLTQGYFVGDGRYASNGFLQESPHPITKITWDNCASMSPKTAEELSVVMNDMVKVEVNGRILDLPVLVQPGMADNTIAVDLGYGREIAGPIGTGVGFNTIKLMSSKDGISNWIYTDVKVSKTEGKYQLVSVQEHHAIDDESLRTPDEFDKDGNMIKEGKTFQEARGIIQETTVNDFKANPNVLHDHQHNVFSITKNHEYPGLKWAMAVDMNKCLGCNACNIACSVENNIPVVGKDQVEVGREMGWIRIDRYYQGTPEDPIVSNQPMLCQHCDNAPCENVCPVVATTHNKEGINQMVYNRCVGTRYCANNCPYKVRRFNFFDFRDRIANGYYKSESTKLAMNPEVTIRARGVMEKCTFCIQRISEAKQIAKQEGRQLKGSDVTTACQDACPSNAITFGSSNEEGSELVKMRNHNLGYHVLDYLNVVPNVTYIAKLRNLETEGVTSEHH